MAGQHYTHIIGSIDSFDVVYAEFNGRRVIDLAADLLDRLERRKDAEALGLFALPETAYSRINKRTIITWYADRPEAATLGSLSGEARAAAEHSLTACLARLVHDEDPEFAALLRACLNIHSADGIMVADGRPVLYGWGLVPAAVAADPMAYEAHLRETIGRYLPPGTLLGLATGIAPEAARPAPEPTRSALSAAGPIAASSSSEAEGAPSEGDGAVAANIAGESLPCPASDADPAPRPGAEATAAAVAGPATEPGGADFRHRRPAGLFPLAAVVVLAGLFLIYVSVPGILVYPDRPGPNLVEAAAVGAGSERFAAMKTEIGRLRTALEIEDSCPVPGGAAQGGLGPGIGDGTASGMTPVPGPVLTVPSFDTEPPSPDPARPPAAALPRSPGARPGIGDGTASGMTPVPGPILTVPSFDTEPPSLDPARPPAAALPRSPSAAPQPGPDALIPLDEPR